MNRHIFIILFIFTIFCCFAENSSLLWCEDGSDLQISDKYSRTAWFNKDIKMEALADGGFSLASHTNKFLRFSEEYPWLCFEITDYELITFGKYRSWGIHIGKQGRRVGNVSEAAPGIYAVKLADSGTELLKFYIYNMKVSFAYLKLVKEPENYLEIIIPDDKTELRVGDKLRFQLTLADHSEDLSCQLFYDAGHGPKAFNLNGTNALDLKPDNEELTKWSTELMIERHGAAKRNSVSVKVTTLGSKLKKPIWGVINAAFVKD